jgi:hypothetical protein
VVSNDPALSAAADEVDKIVHPRYEDWCASTVLDHRGGVVSGVSGVKVVLKDAELSEKTMLALVRKVMADR